MHERDRKIFRKVMVDRQNVHFYFKWAAMIPTLRTTGLDSFVCTKLFILLYFHSLKERYKKWRQLSIKYFEHRSWLDNSGNS